MAERRMIAKTIATSDAFLDMPASARCLYFTFLVLADDDGFINNPKSVMRQIGASNDDGSILVAKKFVIPFDSGVIVIKHWRIHNYLRNDRYIPTKYQDEMKQLELDENKAYKLAKNDLVYQLDTNGIPTGTQLDTQYRIGKDSIGNKKENIKEKNEEEKAIDEVLELGNKKQTYGQYKKVKLSLSEFARLQSEFGNAQELVEFLDEAKEQYGYKYKSDYLAIRKWVVDAVKEKKNKGKKPQSYTEDEMTCAEQNIEDIRKELFKE